MAYSDVVLAESSLQSYWRLGESIGNGSAADSKGSVTGAYAQVTLETPGLVAGDSNTAGDFNGDTGGVNGSRIDLGNVYTFNGTVAFSVEAWMKPDTIDGTNRRLLNRGDSSNAWRISVASSYGCRVERRISSTSRQVDSGSGSIVAGSVYHVVATYDDPTLTLYVNGVSVGTPNTTGGTLAVAGTSTLIGNRAGVINETFDGVLDEIAVYNAALSLSQVQAHYVAGTGQVLLPDADVATTGWSTAPLFSKINDSSDATIITATAS